MVETNPEQIQEGGDGFMRTNKAEVESFVMEESIIVLEQGGQGWSQRELQHLKKALEEVGDRPCRCGVGRRDSRVLGVCWVGTEAGATGVE